MLFLHVFNHPEIPKNYRLLQFFGRAEPPASFKLESVPEGEQGDPVSLYRRYAALEKDTVSDLNRALIRNYLTHLSEPDLIQYIEGDFKVTDVRQLVEGDLFYPGLAVKGVAMVRPDEFSEPAPWPLSIEYLIPTESKPESPVANVDQLLKLMKVPNCPILIHVDQVPESDPPHVVLTFVPIVPGEYESVDGTSVTISTPTVESLRPGAELPAFKLTEDQNSQ